MNRTKKDVDRHAQDIFRKIKTEKERNLRCFQIARMYYEVGEYDIAQKYIHNFLTQRPESAEAHKLLGDILDKLNQKDKAIAEYKASLELESKQPHLVLKVCELMADSNVILDVERARYWCERAENHFPHHPSIFRLKEKMLKAKGTDNTIDLESLIAAELVARPKDVSLRIKLLQHYMKHGRLKDAYCHAIQADEHNAFKDSLSWYSCLKKVFQLYEDENSCTKDWEFYMHYMLVMERVVYLLLQEQRAMDVGKNMGDTVQALFSFDQLLEKSSKLTVSPSQQDLFQEVLRHMRGQLCLHLSTVILKRAKKEQSSWKDSCRAASSLLLHALIHPIDIKGVWILHLTEARKKFVERLALEGANRFSQAGHVILGMILDNRNHFMESASQYCFGNWRERVYQRIFTSRDYQQSMLTSYFVNTSAFVDVTLRLPTSTELKVYDERSQKLYPDSLHHMTWLGLHAMYGPRQSGIPKVGDFRCVLFERWPLSSNKLNVSTAETINQLDVDAFLYATVLCASSNIDEMKIQGFHSSDEPLSLPACITQPLCTATQASWWTYVYQMYTNQLGGNVSDARQVLRKGIEVVRVMSCHGLDVKLIVLLAKIFSERAIAVSARTDNASDVNAIEARAELYWDTALPLLDRLRRNQAINMPQNRMFEYKGKELSSAEVSSYIEEGYLFLACQLMKRDEHEKALEKFRDLKSPYASYYQGKIYSKLASEELGSQHGSNITSEMRSRHVILLTKARDCYYLTLDRLRAPGVDPNHPLNADLIVHIDEVENQLRRIAPEGSVEVNHELDAASEESFSFRSTDNISLQGVGSNGNFILHSNLLSVPRSNRHRISYQSTPHRFDSTLGQTPRRTEVRPSPERLDAQIRQLLHTHGTQVNNVTEQFKSLLLENQQSNLQQMKSYVADSQKTVLAEIQEIKGSVEELKKEVQEIKKEVKTRRGQCNTDFSGIGDDDLLGFDDDYQDTDVNAVNHPLASYATFPTHSSYPRMLFTPGEPQPTAPPLIPPAFFPRIDALMFPPHLSNPNYYNALPFSDGQQLPDFRTMPHPSQTFIQFADNKMPPKQMQGPNNVVITTSDTLPKTVPSTLPTLSVTIPPQHRPPAFSRSQVPVPNVPHEFQIPMPPQAQFPQATALDNEEAIDLNYLSKGTRKSVGSESHQSDEDVEEGDHDPSFEPIISLPEEVDVPTGEEEELVLFQNRAKLYRFVENEWKERGVGTLKLLHNQATGKVRVLMRRDQVLKICANHIIDSSMELIQMNDKAWIWAANDFADEEIRLEKLCARFKNSYEALSFKEAFDRAKCLNSSFNDTHAYEGVTSSTDKTKTVTSPAKSNLLAPAKLSFTNSASEPITGITTVSTPNTVVSKTSSNISFSMLSTKPDIKTTTTLQTEKGGSEKSGASAVKSGSASVPKVSYGGFTFISTPSVKTEEKTSVPSNQVSTKTKDEKTEKPSPFAGFSFTVPKTTSPVSLSKSTSTTTVSKPVITDSNKPKLKESEENKSFSLKSFDSNLSFASIAQTQTSNQGFKKDSTFTGFEGAGTPVFGKAKTSGNSHTTTSEKKTPSKDDDGVEDFVPTAEFQPVVPLPDIVEVKTGEEGEELLYKQRAKLMRFDVDSKQWKERGVGEMKVLRNPTTGRVRLLMRREQVLKVCCNHCVTSTMELKNSPNSDCSVTWLAQDFSDGELKHEAFAIRFKTASQLQEFKSVLNDAIDEIRKKEEQETKLGSKETKTEDRAWECKKCHLLNDGDCEVCVSCKATNPNSLSAKKPLSELFKPKSDSWSCNTCYVRNDSSSANCVACNTVNPTLPVVFDKGSSTNGSSDNSVKFSFGFAQATSNIAEVKNNTPLSEIFKPKPGTWECKSCYVRNESTAKTCISCGSLNSNTSQSSSNPIASQPAQETQFSFGVPQNKLNSTNAQDTRPLSELFKPPPGSWECKDCYVRNVSTANVCVTCGSSNPNASQSTQDSIQPSGFKFNSVPFEGIKFSFGVPRNDPAVTADSSLTSVTTSSTSVVSTAKTVPNLSFGNKPLPATSTGNSFTFGSAHGFNFNISNATAKSPVKSPKSPKSPGAQSGEDGSGSEVEEDEGEHIHFQPLIPLPDKVPVVTGEEDEDVLYCHRAKLFRYCNNEWKERGIGDVKLLRHRSTNKLRLLMRRETILKICLNHFLTPEITMTKKDDKSWIWAAPDFSDGEIVNEKFVIRFKSSDIAKEFYDAVTSAQASLDGKAAIQFAKTSEKKDSTPQESDNTVSSTSSTPLSSFTFSLPKSSGEEPVFVSTPKFSLAGRIQGPAAGPVRHLFGGSPSEAKSTDSSDGSIEVLYELEVSPEERAAAESYQLPKNFYSYLRKPPCPGCIGCEQDSDPEIEKCEKVATPVKSKTETSTPFVFNLSGNTTKPSLIFGGKSSEAPKEVSIFGGKSSEAPKEVSIFGGKSSEASKEASSLIFGGKSSEASKEVSSVTAHTPATTTSFLFGQSFSDTTTVAAGSSTQSIFGGQKTLFGGQTTLTPIFGPKPVTTTTKSSSSSVIFNSPLATSKNVPLFAVGSSKDSVQSSTQTSVVISVPSTTVAKSEDCKTNDVSITKISTEKVDKKEDIKSEGLSFSLKSMPSFGDIAKSSTISFGSNSNNNFTWGSTNVPVFGSSSVSKTESTNKADSSGDEGEEGDESTSHDPHFEPVIAMPDVVEVKTGEEEEEKLFSTRAKLYRYESKSKEWKERGVGELKILYHPVRNTYRLVLRREQVHKVVCNHLITSSIELSPLSSSDKAYVWAAMNHVEDNPCVEKLCARFKSPEVAQEFKSKVEECIRNLAAKSEFDTVQTEENDSYERRSTLPIVDLVQGAQNANDDNEYSHEEEREGYDEEGEYDDYDEEEEEEDEDDEDQKTYFRKRVTLSVQNQNSPNKYDALGLGELQVLYDSEIYGARIVVVNDHGEELCNTVIAMNSSIDLDNKNCVWSGIDYSSTTYLSKKFLATFSSEAAAIEFYGAFQEGIGYAKQSEIVEFIIPESASASK